MYFGWGLDVLFYCCLKLLCVGLVGLLYAALLYPVVVVGGTSNITIFNCTHAMKQLCQPCEPGFFANISELFLFYSNISNDYNIIAEDFSINFMNHKPFLLKLEHYAT